MLDLDDRDIQILTVIEENGRITIADLAKRVHLSPSPCKKRLARLEESGIISGYGAVISLAHIFSHVSLFVTIKLESQHPRLEANFEGYVKSKVQIIGCWSIGGDIDFLLQVITSDMAEYQNLMEDLLEADLGVFEYFSHLVTKEVISPNTSPKLRLIQ